MSKEKLSNSATNKTRAESGAPVKPKGKGLLVGIVIILLLVACVVLVFMLNLGGVRDLAMNILTPTDVESEAENADTQLNEQLRNIQDEVIRLNEMEDELNARGAQLDARETELGIRENELAASEQEIAGLRDQLSPQVENIESIAKMYENMEPEQAALILSEMEEIDVIILVLRNLDQQKAGEILGFMEPGLAAQILNRMMVP